MAINNPWKNTPAGKVVEKVTTPKEAQRVIEKKKEIKKRGKISVGPMAAREKLEEKVTYGQIEKDISSKKKDIAKQVFENPFETAFIEKTQGKPYESSMRNLSQQEKQIKQLQSEGYNIKKQDDTYIFYKTAKQVENEALQQQKKKIRSLYDKPSVAGFAHTWSTGVLSWEDPLSIKSFYYTVTGQREKVIETKARASIDLDAALSKGLPSYAMKVSTGPVAVIGTSYVGGAGIGAGFGALKTVVPTIGKIAEASFGIGMAAYSVKQTAPRIQRSLETKDYANIASDIGYLGISAYAGYAGYRTGYIFGSGRTQAYLYRKHTFEPGSVGDIRFKEALKISRKLESVKSHKMQPLDIAKDISRMDEATAAKTIEFLKQNPRTTIGGSAASYTQIEGARTPQDIDLLVTGGKKSVSSAKSFFGKTKTEYGQHLIDIHGKEFYNPGQHHIFGFRSKSPVKIESNRFFRAGEQLFRKGAASVKKETSYRWFKDVPDFITHAESLIKSAKGRWYQKGKALSAEKSLQNFINPSIKTYSPLRLKTAKFITSFTKKPSMPKRAYLLSSTGFAKQGYAYPTGMGGYYGIGSLSAIGSYSSYQRTNSKKINIPTYTVKILDKPVPMSSTYIIKNKDMYPKIITDPSPVISYKSYNAEKQIMKPVTSPYTQPGYKEQPFIFKPSKKKSVYDDIIIEKKNKINIEKIFGEEYKFRKFDIPDLNELFKGVI